MNKKVNGYVKNGRSNNMFEAVKHFLVAQGDPSNSTSELIDYI